MTPAAQRGVDLCAAGVAAVVAAVLAWSVLQEGFPDGHLTTYQRVSRFPRLGVHVTALMGSVWLVLRARPSARAGWARRWGGAVSLGTLVLLAGWGLPWFFQR